MIAPTDGQAPDVLAPAALGPVRLRNRILKAATFEGMTPGGLVSDELIDFHVRHAAGGTGMTTVAYCAVSPEGRTTRDQVYWRPEAMPGLRRLTDAVHRQGAAVSAQIGHAGPVADPRSTGLPAIGPGRTPNPQALSVARPARRSDLDRVVRRHAAAAAMAAEAGFDAVEVHFGHNYLASAFLSPRLNRRTDSYGGSLRNRARLVRDIGRAVRDAVGDRIGLIAKLNMDDGVPGGLWLDESIQVARWLEEDGSLDALELTAGSSLLNPMYLLRGDAPVRELAAVQRQPVRLGLRLAGSALLRPFPYSANYLLPDARQVRAEVDMPLILMGGVADRPAMDTAMQEGFQFVAMARALLRQPDLVNRIAADPAAGSLCIHCNRCMPTIPAGTRCVLAEPAVH